MTLKRGGSCVPKATSVKQIGGIDPALGEVMARLPSRAATGFFVGSVVITMLIHFN